MNYALYFILSLIVLFWECFKLSALSAFSLCLRLLIKSVFTLRSFIELQARKTTISKPHITKISFSTWSGNNIKAFQTYDERLSFQKNISWILNSGFRQSRQIYTYSIWCRIRIILLKASILHLLKKDYFQSSNDVLLFVGNTVCT